ncbi:endonuclease/exonuclease/phosphatase family protein [Pectobacterium aroidearum]|uniref:Endonuclease/exonuclease/phosphatase family protein n=1 Tax=Pectobacterium aroidearum TaxID=1201031 RepID=A0ABR5ZB23_9GAMM|nr:MULTISPECIES: endonuclease/exonuclease/phosphatase family protein [Pectobacterium]MBA5198945.1 endonuclease/exonuclease/phosphatase family protein [Pectobacterium aroidearum]MBA5231737.1 endonuclease/exonuclease/phosphatase family protein [Pectobacterium aroidearum]
MELNICWWNIGISPPIRIVKKDKQEAIEMAKEYIKYFSQEKNVDLFALCEISQDEAINFNILARDLEMEYLDLSGRVGRIIIDMSILYETSKLEFISYKYITKIQPDGKTLRVGVRVVFKDVITDRYLTFFLSHWPSRVSADEKIREDVAEALRNCITKIIDDHGVESQIICMGDYNTNPYSVAINEKLYATRDYHQIIKKRNLLFNPCWFLLSDKKTNNIGTYHHKSGASNRWYVFDQMLFSSSFIAGNNDCLKLDIDSLDFHRILSEDNGCLDDDFYRTFDHYPIFCRIHHEH